MLSEFIYSNNWLDQLFQNKNKLYGAYELRKRNAHNTFIAFIWAMSIFGGIGLTGFVSYKIYLSFFDTPVVVKPYDDLGGIMVDLPPNTKPPVEDNLKPPKGPTSKSNTVPLIVDSALVDKGDNKQSANSGSNGNTTGNNNDSTGTDLSGGNTGGSGLLPPIEKKPAIWAEVMPKFPGGEEAMVNWLGKNIKYPEELRDRNKQGIVYVQFVVSETGRVEDITIIKGVDDAPQFSQAAIKAISNMPLWTPGQQNGQDVPVYFTLPVNFRLK